MSKVKWTYEQLQAIEKSGNNILVAAASGVQTARNICKK